MKSAHRNLLLLCFLTSGATSLAFEVAWSKQLSYLLGNTLFAVSTVVAAFMAGLALGSLLASRYAERLEAPVRWYGLIQVAVGAFGIASIPLLRSSAPLFRWVYQTFDPSPAAFLSVRFFVVFLLMSAPVTLMGMTLPVVVGAMARNKDTYSYEAGLFYGVNTLGAVAGTLGAGFFLLPSLGLFGTCIAAGLLDAMAGAVAIGLQRRLAGAGPRPAPSAPPKKGAKGPAEPPEVPAAAGWTARQWTVGLLFGLSGAVAILYELSWFRLLGLVLGPSVVAFSAMLGVYLAGIALGSALLARRVERLGVSGLALMAGLEVVLGLMGGAGLLYFNGLPSLYFNIFKMLGAGASGAGAWLAHLGLAAAVVFPPCFVMGILFPASVRALRESGPWRSPEANVGRLYLMNTLGGIGGSLAAGFWLIPSVGLGRTLASAAVASGAIGAALLAAGAAPPLRRCALALAAASSCVLLAVFSPPLDLLHLNLGAYRNLYTSGAPGGRDEAGTKLLFYREGLNAPVAVYNFDGTGSLRVSGKADASAGSGAERITQLLAGHLPVLFSKRAERVAVVGYGSGMSAGAVLAHPEVRSADIMEIEGAIIEASPFFESINRGALKDPRANLIIEDARVYLTYCDKTYDVMAVEPSNPWMAGVSNLFTTDFYRIAKSHLAPGGIFCCWIQTYESSPETFRVMLASVREVFPHIVLFHNRGDTLMLCSQEPIAADWERLEGRMAAPEVASSLREIGIRSPAHLWPFLRAADAGLDGFLSETQQRNTDDNVWLEHHAVRQLLRASSSGDSQRLNTALTLLGVEGRIRAFQSLVPRADPSYWLKEGLLLTFSGEPLLVGEDRILDAWLDVRQALVPGVRRELRERGPAALLKPFETWVEEFERYRASRFRATADLKQPQPDEPRAKYGHLARILASAPDLPMANNAMADFLITEGRDFNASEPYYVKAAEDWTSPNCYGARINLGNIALIRSNYEGKDLWAEAEAHYRSAIQWNPFTPRAYVSLAQCHILHQDLPAAERVLKEGLIFNPGAPEIVEKQAEIRGGGPTASPAQKAP